ncbi:unnamed protein product, partial [Effrenium voratum]
MVSDLFIRDKDEEAPSKRMRKGADAEMQVGAVTDFVHMDFDESAGQDFGDAWEEISDAGELTAEDVEAEADANVQQKLQQLMLPRTNETEPQLTMEELECLDSLASEVEVHRLRKMQVLLDLDAALSEDRDSPLSAKFVNTWRSKYDGDRPVWLRRARLVAREYNFLQKREDTFLPASPTLLLKLLPILYNS